MLQSPQSYISNINKNARFSDERITLTLNNDILDFVRFKGISGFDISHFKTYGEVIIRWSKKYQEPPPVILATKTIKIITFNTSQRLHAISGPGMNINFIMNINGSLDLRVAAINGDFLRLEDEVLIISTGLKIQTKRENVVKICSPPPPPIYVEPIVQQKEEKQPVFTEKIRDTINCVVCMSEPYCMLALGCGHLCCCLACSEHLDSCPICRKKVERWQKIYMA